MTISLAELVVLLDALTVSLAAQYEGAYSYSKETRQDVWGNLHDKMSLEEIECE